MSEYPRRWAALGVLSLTLVATTLDNSVLNTALPSLARELQASMSDLQWITNAYTLVFASVLILAGGIGARIGSRVALLGGLVVFGGGSAIAALSDSPDELIAWRAVMGLGAAFIMPSTLAIITRIFPASERPKAFGVWSAAAGIGVVLGPVTGGVLLEHYSWSSAFWINVPLVAVALVAVLILVPSVPAEREGRLDILGAILITAAMTLLVDFIIQAPERGWTDNLGFGELGLALLLGALFVSWQLKTTSPLVRLGMFANRTFLVAALALTVAFFVMFGMVFEMTQYLQLVHGFSPLKAGLSGMPFAFGMAATAIISPMLVKRIGVRWILVLGLSLIGVAMLWHSFTEVDSAYWRVLVGNGVVGLGTGMMMAPASLQITGSVPVAYSSMASALNSVTRELGGVLGIAVIGTVVSTVYLDTPNLPLGDADLASVHMAAASLPPDVAQRAVEAANEAFTTAMGRGLLLGAVVAFVAAVLAAFVRPAAPKATEPSGTAVDEATGPSGTTVDEPSIEVPAEPALKAQRA